MAITFEYKIVDDLLLVESNGCDDGINEALNYNLSIINIARENNITKAVIDERKVEYRLSTFDTFKLAEFVVEQIPGAGKFALVFDKKYSDDITFWETVIVNCGLTARVFDNPESALKWVNS